MFKLIHLIRNELPFIRVGGPGNGKTSCVKYALQYHQYDFINANGLYDQNFKKMVQNSQNKIVVIDGYT